MSMPDEVPILSAENIEIGPYQSTSSCGCLMFHFRRTFKKDPFHEPDRSAIGRALIRSHQELRTGVDSSDRMGGPRWATYSTDACKVTKSLMARVWNRAMALLGYTVNNPECVRGKLKPVKASRRK